MRARVLTKEELSRLPEFECETKAYMQFRDWQGGYRLDNETLSYCGEVLNFRITSDIEYPYLFQVNVLSFIGFPDFAVEKF